ncbi:hypothetical protein CHRY9390_01420 [Chryseobacterium aquaeductus]|uniref:HTH luxR-type domain-containing protein n=1 Tax=Chryseobacterium aquaeductus TaxID=2675056 RepID=A0A9N8QRZ4_9FLAO|nr:hypothetical protein [Chryseobacterium aquaeductus]CAA7330747.1 hypothetical protein CHRY9390_01420 [Chryseobacterium potabilaquae]CAD7805799.1 hypothetical protein CHRY9390_01420 [Chryseobacterium aquaeductus]
MDFQRSSCQIFVILLILLSNLFSAQDDENANQKINHLINQTNQLFLAGKTDAVLASSKTIIAQSEKLNSEKGLSYGYYYLATYYYDNAEFRESIKIAKKAQEYDSYLSQDKTHAARISALLGGNYLLLELYTLSSKNYRTTLKILDSKPKKNTTDSLTESAAYSNLSYLFYNINMRDSMYFYLKKEKVILKKIKFKDAYIEKGCSCLGFGNYHLSQNKIDSAQYYYNKSLAFFSTNKHPCKIESLIGLGNLYTQEKDYDKAHFFYDNALKSFNQNTFPDIQSELYKKISELYIAEGNALQAKKYNDLYVKIFSPLDARQKKERDFVLNEVMKEEKENHEAEVMRNRKVTILIISLLVLITLFIVYLLRKSKSKNQETLEITQQLRSEKLINEKTNDSLKLQLNEAFEEIRKLAKENNPEFFIRFQEIYPTFSIKMLELNPKFKVSELTFAAYIYLGFNTKEIAEHTFKAVKTIENNRYNLRKKLEISPEKDLQIWLRNYIDSE